MSTMTYIAAIGEAAALGWARVLPLLQGAGARAVFLAHDGRWGSAIDLSTTLYAVGRVRRIR